MNRSSRRLRRMHDRLFQLRGPQHWWPAESAEEVIVGAYLTQNTAWKAVERALANLREAGELSLRSIADLSIERLQELLKPSGFVTRKAPSLKAFVAFLDAEYGGSLEQMGTEATAVLRNKLLALPGVGPETADAILLYALEHPVPVADEYLRRIAERHGLLPLPLRKNRQSYEALAKLTREAFQNDPAEKQRALFNEFHALTVAVGKTHCGRTAHCEECPLAEDLKDARR